MHKRLAIIAVPLFGCLIGYAQQHPCTDSQLRHAETEAVTLRSWDALFTSYKLYGRCGDVDAAEGYSESVARILVDHWDSLPRLAQLARKDAAFRDFVLGHVDATLNMKDVRMIKIKAMKQCPTGLRSLCTELKKQADAAIEEDAAVYKKN